MALLGTTDPELAALLGLDPEKIRQQQQQAGLLSAGLAMLAASGPSRTPTSLGQIIGQGGMVGMQAYGQAGQQAVEQGVQRLRVGELKTALEDRQKAREASDRFRQRMSDISGGVTTPSMALAGGGGPTQQAAAQIGKPINVEDEQRKAATELLGTIAPAELAKTAFKEPRQLPADLQGYQVARSQGYTGTFLNYQQDLRRAGASNVSVNTEKSYGGALAGEMAKSDAAKFEAANSAPRVIETIQSTRQLLDSGNVITGIGAQQRLDLARLGQFLGVGGKNNNELIANTQQLFANRAQATLDSIRSSGLGAGQGFSNKDREFLENARLGNITYSPEALRRQLTIEENVAKATVSSWNSRLKNIPAEARTSLGLGEVSIPAETPVRQAPGKAPPGVRQELWDVMTPEQKRLWQ
jgi:hypothetical protein